MTDLKRLAAKLPTKKEIKTQAEKYAMLEEYPNTVWRRQGFVDGAIWLRDNIRLARAAEKKARGYEDK